MRRLPSVASSPLFLPVLLCTSPHGASAVGIAGFDSCGVTSGGAQLSAIDSVDFHPYKVPSDHYPHANRDLEFLWSDRYSTLFGRPLTAVRPPGQDNDLDLLGRTICEQQGTGAFGFPIPYIQLIYDYLRAPGFGRPSSVDVYDTNNGLSATDRVTLLVHNWRVANYVNQPALAEGQYGFPSQFGFNPITALGAWQNIDAGAADTANIELEVRLDSDQLTRELTFAGQSTNTLHPANAHAVALAHFGSEYWVVRSDPSLWASNHDLIIRMMPEGICAVRLFVSAIAYSEQNLPSGQPDSLWKHPEWAQSAMAPRWSDVVTMVDPLELVGPPRAGYSNRISFFWPLHPALPGGARSIAVRPAPSPAPPRRPPRHRPAHGRARACA